MNLFTEIGLLGCRLNIATGILLILGVIMLNESNWKALVPKFKPLFIIGTILTCIGFIFSR